MMVKQKMLNLDLRIEFFCVSLYRKCEFVPFFWRI